MMNDEDLHMISNLGGFVTKAINVDTLAANILIALIVKPCTDVNECNDVELIERSIQLAKKFAERMQP